MMWMAVVDCIALGRQEVRTMVVVRLVSDEPDGGDDEARLRRPLVPSQENRGCPAVGAAVAIRGTHLRIVVSTDTMA